MPFSVNSGLKNEKKIIYTNLFLLMLVLVNPSQSFGWGRRVTTSITANDRAFSPKGANYLYFKPTQQEIAKIFVYNGRFHKTVSIAEAESPVRYGSLNYQWYNDDLLEINIGTGSPGNYSIFYSVDNNKISEEHWFTVAVDPKRYLVLQGEEDVFITGIFDTKQKYKLNLNFYDAATKWLVIDLEHTSFDKDGNLLIRYQNPAKKWLTARIEKEMIKLQ